MNFKPMLACSTVPGFEEVKYPVVASPKLDGIRCLAVKGQAFSRNGKLIPNQHIQAYFKKHNLDGFDGELMLVKGDFNSIQSAFMSRTGTPNFTYNVFDLWRDAEEGFVSRLERLRWCMQKYKNTRLLMVPQLMVDGPVDLSSYLSECLECGYEGLIIRDPDGPYKHGRSTKKQGWMSKIKLFNDDEASVVDVIELYHNMDTSTKEQANLVPGGVMGALVVLWKGRQFKIGSGFDNVMREELWIDRHELIGRRVTFKYQELSKYGIPRFPIFKSFRDID